MSLWDGIKNIMNVSDDEYEDDETLEEDYEPEVVKKESPIQKREPVRTAFSYRKSKTVAFNTGDNMQLVLVKPERFEDVTGIADHYCAKKTIVLNLERADRDLSRRIIDFLSGVAYANHGNIRKVANSTFIIVARDVDIMGELMLDELGESKLYF